MNTPTAISSPPAWGLEFFLCVQTGSIFYLHPDESPSTEEGGGGGSREVSQKSKPSYWIAVGIHALGRNKWGWFDTYNNSFMTASPLAELASKALISLGCLPVLTRAKGSISWPVLASLGEDTVEGRNQHQNAFLHMLSFCTKKNI